MILPGPRRSWPWSGVALLAAALVGLPILTVLASLARPEWALWAHLARTQLPELLLNTLALVIAVGLGVLLLGTTLAWLVVTCEFPGRRLFEWALVLPLALPAYVMGFVLLGSIRVRGADPDRPPRLARPGRALPGSPRGLGGRAHDDAGLLSLRLHAGASGVRGAGAGAPRDRPQPRPVATGDPSGVALPLARPALVAGGALAMMEALADLGTVSLFGYRTLTETVYRVWHGHVRPDGGDPARGILLGSARSPPDARARSRAGRARFTQRRAAGRRPARRGCTGMPGARRDRALRRRPRPRLRAARRPARALGPGGAAREDRVPDGFLHALLAEPGSRRAPRRSSRRWPCPRLRAPAAGPRRS